ncbi:hypothetical protein [Oceanispirochaeta sp.]|jgi:protein-L-isoaspartate(D-aspartate) O-methyltransferase|uniref:protein-L-isoaspartate O-methyltransferase family protein n=1 Tax=Oceanispirochaeta sp. TaxID=2035350 RepID=UPI00262AFB25|nr:hypothetical protein [Oceanispirochaeta sp.]MDA3958183.1 hypothetical protein [Oceanispirochaeta sp.]
MKSLEDLIIHLRHQGVLENPDIEKAFRRINRADFVLPEFTSNPYGDFPLPIGWNQTISQPYTVAFMLNLLQIEPGQSVLDIGSGSGWTTALLAAIVGSEGEVLGLERLPELVSFGRGNLAKYPDLPARIHPSGPDPGMPGKKYDRILVSASADHFPEALGNQLKNGGIMVIPVDHSIWTVRRTSEGLETKTVYGFSFVPLILAD